MHFAAGGILQGDAARWLVFALRVIGVRSRVRVARGVANCECGGSASLAILMPDLALQIILRLQFTLLLAVRKPHKVRVCLYLKGTYCEFIRTVQTGNGP